MKISTSIFAVVSIGCGFTQLKAAEPLPRFETKPLTVGDRAEFQALARPDGWEEKVKVGAIDAFVKLSSDRGHWQAVKNYVQDSTLTDTMISSRMSALSQDPYALKDNNTEIKGQITSQYSKNSADQFKDVPIFQKVKSGFQFQLNFSNGEENKLAQAKQDKKIRYGLMIEDITTVKSPDFASLDDNEFRQDAQRAKVKYTIGRIEENNLSLTHVDENIIEDEEMNQPYFKAPSPNMKFEFLPSSGGVPSLSGSKFAMYQVEGLFRTEYVTANGDNASKTTQMVKFPIYKALCVVENYDNFKIHTTTTYGGLLVNDTMPNLSVSKIHVEDRWRSDMAWTLSVHTVKAGIEMAPAWKPGDKTRQDGEHYTVEYSRPL